MNASGIYLVLGGVKSGKSRRAEQLASSLSLKQGKDVYYIATAQALDAEMSERIARHKESRPSDWHTIEEPIKLSSTITSLPAESVVLIDCLTLWLTNMLMKQDQGLLEQELEAFSSLLRSRSAPLVMVSNETNMGIIPMDPLSRRFCDYAGRMHQVIAELCTNVELMVAGLPIVVKGD